jgi:hypothetical protein
MVDTAVRPGAMPGSSPHSTVECNASMKTYLDFHDWWIGYYRGDSHHYVCPLPTVVIRWDRRAAALDSPPDEVGDGLEEDPYDDEPCTCLECKAGA